jgi:hypothetical protein
MIGTNYTKVVAYLHNQGGTHSHSLYLLCKSLCCFCQSLIVILSVRHVLGNLNLLADALSRSLNPVNTQWALHPAVFQEIWLKRDCPHVDLSDTSEFQIPTYVSPIPDNKALVVDAMSLPWKGMFSYMSPHLSLSSQDSKQIQCLILQNLHLSWPLWSSLPDLQLFCAKPICLPSWLS